MCGALISIFEGALSKQKKTRISGNKVSPHTNLSSISPPWIPFIRQTHQRSTIFYTDPRDLNRASPLSMEWLHRPRVASLNSSTDKFISRAAVVTSESSSDQWTWPSHHSIQKMLLLYPKIIAVCIIVTMALGTLIFCIKSVRAVISTVLYHLPLCLSVISCNSPLLGHHLIRSVNEIPIFARFIEWDLSIWVLPRYLAQQGSRALKL